MKNFILMAFTAAVMTFALNAKGVDLSKKPDPLPAQGFVFPDYEVKTLTNGLKVFIIEDHEQPTISMNLMFAGGTSVDGIAGTGEMVASMLTKGTENLSAQEIAAKMDGLGIGFGASANSDALNISASGLKKHTSVMLEVMADVIQNSKFPQEELDKLKSQAIAGLQYEKSSSSALAQKLARMVIYGEGHPYSQYSTEESINNISREDLVKYHERFLNPNNATLSVIGDVKSDEIIDALEEEFRQWTPKSLAPIRVPMANTMPSGVYFVERPGAVQSTMIISALGLPRSHEDYLKLEMVADIMGSGFSGRINRTIREKYAFSYGGYGSLTGLKYTNRIFFGSDVAKEKTDSSVMVMLGLIDSLVSTAPGREELMRIKNYQIGSYLMAFENSSFVAGLVQTSDFQGIPIETVKMRPELMMKMPAEDIRKTAAQFLGRGNLRIVIVGDPSLKPALKKYGEIFAYDIDMKKIGAAEPVSMSPSELLAKYEKALGGKEAIGKINSITAISDVKVAVQGREFEGKVIEKTARGNKFHATLDIQVFKQDVWVNGDKVWLGQNGQNSQVPEQETKRFVFESELFGYTKLSKFPYTLEIEGKKDDKIILKVKKPRGEVETIYFNANNFLIDKIVSMNPTPQGNMEESIKYEKYEKISGVMMPVISTKSSAQMVMKMNISYKVNENIDDSEFSPKG